MTTDPGAAEFLKTLTVLHVEDEPKSREAVGVFLRRRVGRLLSAADGAEGLRVFQAERPRIVVTDIQMPNMDGLAMARELRSLDPGIPIIITTAFEQTSYMTRSIEIGIDRYVVKPVQGDTLEAALLVCAHRLLAEEQLRLKEKLAAEAVRARHHAAMSVLLGGIAHDYNNLLQAVLLGVQLAGLKLATGADANPALDISRNATEEAARLSHRLLSLIQAPADRPLTGPVDDLLRGAVAEALRGSGVQAVFDLQGGSAPIDHHQENLAEAFRSLVDNAREAMPAGGTLTVSTAVRLLPEGQGLPPGRYLQVRFADTGPGIPADILPRIFEPYFSTKERSTQRGMGLGLALCEAVVQAHRGGIAAEDGDGGGAVLVLHLPVAGGG